MLKNIINTLFTRILASVVNLVVAILISRVYGAAIKGEQGLILTTITLITLVTAIIGSGSSIYLTPRVKTKYLLFPSYVWNLVVCLGVFFILIHTEILAGEYILHTAILSLILTGSQIHTGILIGAERIRQSNFAFLVNTVFVFLSLLFFIFVMRIETVYAYIYSLYVGYSLQYLVLIFSTLRNWNAYFRPINPPDSTLKRGFLDLLHYGFLNQMDVIAQMLSFRLSYYFIDYYLSKSAVGIYSNAVSIIESIWLISRSIAMVQNARIANSTDSEYSVRITVNLMKISFSLVLIAVIILIAIPAGFYEFLFGTEFGEIRTVILFIAPGVLLFSISFILSGLFSGTGKFIYNTTASIAGLTVTLLLAFILIPRYGLAGAGITASVSYLISVVVKLYFLFSKYGVKGKDLILKKAEIREFIAMLKK